MSVVVCPKQPLSRSLDVPISISRPQSEIATDMTMICFVTPGVEFLPDNNRVQFFSSMDALTAAVPQNSEAYYAGQAFFSRSDRPATMAVGRVVTAPTSGTLASGELTLSRLNNISDGAFKITIADEEVAVADLNFGASATLSGVVSALNSALSGKATVTADEDAGTLTIATVETGDGADITYASSPDSGTDVSELLMLTQATATSRINGYTPGDLVSEIGLIQTAARCAGRAVFGWILDRQYRDTEEQKAVADWAEAQDQAYFSACTNSVQAYNTADTTNIGYYCQNKGYIKTSTIYHENAQVYPDMSYAALAMSVNYALENSTLTMKFKQLTGIETSPLTETQVSALASRNINCYVSMGNSASVVREGVQGADTWFTDSHINLSNYKEELQVEVFNVFLRNKKIPYTSAGQDILVSAVAKINRRYTRNGTFADREVETTDNETGVETLPATNISPASVASATTSDRAARLAPPIEVTCYEAGAFHKVSLTVTVYN